VNVRFARRKKIVAAGPVTAVGDVHRAGTSTSRLHARRACIIPIRLARIHTFSPLGAYSSGDCCSHIALKVCDAFRASRRVTRDMVHAEQRVRATLQNATAEPSPQPRTRQVVPSKARSAVVDVELLMCRLADCSGSFCPLSARSTRPCCPSDVSVSQLVAKHSLTVGTRSMSTLDFCLVIPVLAGEAERVLPV